MNTTAVGIADFSLITVLGKDKSTQLHQAMSGNLGGMKIDTTLLRGRETVVGRIDTTLPTLPESLASFNFRASRLLMQVIDDLNSNIEKIKSRYPLNRIGVIMATSTSGVDSLEQSLPYFDCEGKWPETYHAHHHRMGSISEFVARYTGVTGPAMTVSTACSSGNKALASAKRWLNANICDAVICGGADVLTELTVRGFDALGALSETHSIPFSTNRKGINIGEAGAMFVLTKSPETLNLLGCGESTDAHHISAPDPTGIGAANAMQLAIADANVVTRDIDYINLHGTGTPQNDSMEANAIHHVFADYATEITCSSCKPQIGHTLGVSGLVELGLSLLSMTNEHNGCLPHCYDGHYDEKILPLKLVKIQNTLSTPNCILSNSFAFGGSNAAVIVGRE